jgi:hypothetical protein
LRRSPRTAAASSRHSPALDHRGARRPPDQAALPALLCFCHDQAVRLLDEILDLADQAVGEAHGQALRELRDLKAQTATAANEKVALFDLLVGLLLDEDVADDEVRARAVPSTATTAPSSCTRSSANRPRRTACTSSPTRSSTGTRSTSSSPSTSLATSPPATSSPG